MVGIMLSERFSNPLDLNDKSHDNLYLSTPKAVVWICRRIEGFLPFLVLVTCSRKLIPENKHKVCNSPIHLFYTHIL